MIPTLTRRSSLLTLIGAAALAAGGPALASADDFGVLVMAHGGGATWNKAVEDMLQPLRDDFRMEVCFGMADPNTLQESVRKLEAAGARRIGVVRLFISGESWYERTEQILGVAPGADPKPAAPTGHGDHGSHGDHGGHGAHAGHGAPAAGGHGGHDMSLWRIETVSSFALTRDGLADAEEMGAVLARRAKTLSQDAAKESILILAHGPEDDAENDRWLAKIDQRAAAVRQAAPYRVVKVDSLREDWPEKRAAAETRIRAFVEDGSKDGGRVIVIPYRVQGFGPYARVLEGLTYASDGQGLLPSPEVEKWVHREAEALRAGAFRKPA